MIIDNGHARITTELLDEGNKSVAWYFVAFPTGNHRAQLEALGWFNTGGDGKFVRVDPELVAFTDSDMATRFAEFIETPEFRDLPEKLWDDADDFNDQANKTPLSVAGNIAFEQNMLNITNSDIADNVKKLWLHIYFTCKGKVWYHSDRFWFESKNDMVMVNVLFSNIDMKAWKTDSTVEDDYISKRNWGKILEDLNKKPPVPYSGRGVWYGNSGMSTAVVGDYSMTTTTAVK